MKAIHYPVLALVLAVSLAACKQEKAVTAENESAESVAKKVAAANIKPLPGRWESTVKLEKMEMEGMPPQAKAAMESQLGKTQTFATCLTPEQVNQPDGGFFQGASAKDCKYDHFTMAGGAVDAKMTCAAGGRTATMEMSGSYGESNYDIRINSQSEVQPGMPMTMAMAITSRRTGDCNGTEKK